MSRFYLYPPFYIGLFCLLFTANVGFAQSESGEFKTFENGLIYNPITIKTLHKIVDSLQLKYKMCEVGRAYRARYQAVGHYVSLTANTAQALADMQKNKSFAEFVEKYPKAQIDRNLLLITEFNNQAENDSVSKIRAIPIQGNYDYFIPLDNRDIIGYYAVPLAKHWVYQTIQTDEGNINLQAFYITREFESKPMATKYGQIAQYIECMVDTTTQVMLQSATVELGVEENDKTKLADFLRLTNNYGKKPTYDQYKIQNGSYDYARYQADFLHWDSLRLTWIDTSLAYTPAFQTALQAAVAECKTRKVPNATLEYFCGKYYSRADELLLARDRLVMGMGSIDAASRYHAREIAVLAAETAHWEVFLRSHLDIMNDRFDPLADNNYAKTTRQTYIKELENLGIDVPNLMLGICLRIENPSQNHYYGDIGRVGRALAESAQQAEIKTMLLDMIADATLDDYNRLLLFHTFLSYNLNLPDEATRTQNTQLLKRTCSSSFPRYLYEKMTW